jgi:DNA gyrase subunit A
MGVKTIGLTEAKGGLAAALIVREHQELVFISQTGMVQRTSVKGISQQGRPAQGVRLMNLREDDRVSAVALVMEDAGDAEVAELEDGDLIDADGDGTVEGADGVVTAEPVDAEAVDSEAADALPDAGEAEGLDDADEAPDDQ